MSANERDGERVEIPDGLPDALADEADAVAESVGVDLEGDSDDE